MPSITLKTTHVTDALSLLTTKYKNSTRVQALLTAIVEQVQDFETAVDGVRTSQTLEGAFALGGVPLDALGDLVGQPREGRDDASFLRFIRARIRVNRSQGLPEDAYKIARALWPDREDFQIEYEAHPPAAFVITITGPIGGVEVGRDAHALLQQGAKAGVRVGLHFTLTPAAETFSFLGGPGLGFNEGAFAGSF